VSERARLGEWVAFLNRPRAVRGGLRVALVTLALLAVIGGATTLELVTPPDDTFGAIPLLCVVAALWLLPARAALLIAVAALAQPIALEEIGQWSQLSAEFQFIAVAVVSVFGLIAVNALVRIGAQRESLIRSLTDFTAQVAHELNSPLSAIRVTADVTLRHGRDTKTYVTSLERIREQAAQLSVLIEGLLLLARRDARALYVRHVPLSMDDVMEELYDRWRGPAERAQVSLDVERETGAELRGDPVLLARLLDNIVDNALRHARSRIAVVSRVDGGSCTVTVEDDGGGFPRGERPATIDELRRGEGPAAEGEGTGLGLTIASAIASEHGGTIRMEHPVGGLRTIVRLPVTSS